MLAKGLKYTHLLNWLPQSEKRPTKENTLSKSRQQKISETTNRCNKLFQTWIWINKETE